MGLETRCPFERGQVWLFRDGREGVCAWANSTGARFYVGPQAFDVPPGDWFAVMIGAAKIAPNDEPRSTPADEVVAELSEVDEPTPKRGRGRRKAAAI